MQARADGMGGEVATEQKKVARAHRITLRELAGLVLWFGIPFLLAGTTIGWGMIILGLAAAAFWLVNGHLVKVADTVTVLMALLTLVIALALASGGWIGLLGVAWFAFYQPFGAFPAIAGRRAAEAYQQAMGQSPQERLRFLQQISAGFPWFRIGRLACPEAITQLLAAIPDGARLLLESDGDGRGAGSHLHFRNWTDSMVAVRGVELVNQFFLLRLVEPALADSYLDRFTAKMLAAATMREVCCGLGASHVLAFSPQTVAGLEAAGFRRVYDVAEPAMADYADALHMPPGDIMLLAAPDVSTVVEPSVGPRRDGNVLRWDAKAGEAYLVRYRHHRNFVARQAGAQLEVVPEAPLAGFALRFMRVMAKADGELELEFKRRWLG
jgi:hypothetical protein